jgi:hypothetical protein
VVWPICNGPIADSIVINFTVKALDPTGVSNPKDDGFSYAVTNTRILLRNSNNTTEFKQVRIYNLLGQDVYHMQGGSITEIPLPSLASGVYLCELLMADNTRRVIKFYH